MELIRRNFESWSLWVLTTGAITVWMLESPSIPGVMVIHLHLSLELIYVLPLTHDV